jgi:hypothetical protein
MHTETAKNGPNEFVFNWANPSASAVAGGCDDVPPMSKLRISFIAVAYQSTPNIYFTYGFDCWYKVSQKLLRTRPMFSATDVAGAVAERGSRGTTARREPRPSLVR